MKAALTALKKIVKINSARKAVGAAANDPGLSQKLKTIIIAAICSLFIPIILIIIIIFGPIMMAQQYIDDAKSEVGLFFEKVGNVLTLNGWCADSDGSCQKKSEQKYYEELNDVYNDYKDKGVEIDAQLITGTIFYGNTIGNDINIEEDDDEDEEIQQLGNLYQSNVDIHLGDIKTLAKNMVSGKRLDFTKYRKYLIDTYIPKRFNNMYNSENAEKAKEKIADEIMMFASLDGGKGSGQFGSCNVINTSCPGVTITGPYAGTYQLEEYVAGVVTHEVGAGWPEEALKAQAIAARTYALNYTNNCTKSIPNGTGAQTFEPATDSNIINAANETAGMVLTYDNQIFSSEYGSWWGNNAGTSCGSYQNCQNGQCSIELYKAPNRESWTFTMPQNYFAWGNVTDNIQMNDGGVQALGGHCRGMTQFGSKYLALGENYTYDKILQTFYSDGVELSTFGNTKNVCPINTSSQGLIASNYKGFMQRVSNPTASDYYYGQEYMYSDNIGQCVWYVQRRAAEIINTIDIDENIRQKAEQAIKSTRGNGRDWWNNPTLQMFGTSTNYAEPKVGAIIVWEYTNSYIESQRSKGLDSNNYGHVGIVEAVDYEAKTMTISDGWKNNWDNPNSINYASFEFVTVPFDWALTYWDSSKYQFMGYVYLLD